MKIEASQSGKSSPDYQDHTTLRHPTTSVSATLNEIATITAKTLATAAKVRETQPCRSLHQAPFRHKVHRANAVSVDQSSRAPVVQSLRLCCIPMVGYQLSGPNETGLKLQEVLSDWWLQASGYQRTCAESRSPSQLTWVKSK